MELQFIYDIIDFQNIPDAGNVHIFMLIFVLYIWAYEILQLNQHKM